MTRWRPVCDYLSIGNLPENWEDYGAYGRVIVVEEGMVIAYVLTFVITKDNVS